MNLKRALKVFEDWYGFKHITSSGIDYKEAWEVIRAEIKEKGRTVRAKHPMQQAKVKTILPSLCNKCTAVKRCLSAGPGRTFCNQVSA